MDNDKAMMYTGIACQLIAILACWLGQMQYVYGALLWAILTTLIRICWKLDK